MDEAIIDRIVTSRSKVHTFNGLPGTNYKPSQEKYDDNDEDGSSRGFTSGSSSSKSKSRKKGDVGGKSGGGASSKGGGPNVVETKEIKETKGGLELKTATTTNTTKRTDGSSGDDQMDKQTLKDCYSMRGIAVHCQVVHRFDNKGVSHVEDIRYIGLSPAVITDANQMAVTSMVAIAATNSTVTATNTNTNSIATGEATAPSEGGDGDIEGDLKSNVSLDPSSMKSDTETGDNTTAIGGVLSRDQILSLRTKLIAQFPPPNLTYMY